MGEITFFVPGEPAPKGSMRAMPRGGSQSTVGPDGNRRWRIRDLIMRPDNPKRLQEWTEALRWAARAHIPPDALEGPVCLEIRAYFRRPKSRTKLAEVAHCMKPDGDKIARAVGDALKSAGVYRDDSYIADWHVRKRYEHEGQPPGAYITIRPWSLEKDGA